MKFKAESYVCFRDGDPEKGYTLKYVHQADSVPDDSYFSPDDSFCDILFSDGTNEADHAKYAQQMADGITMAEMLESYRKELGLSLPMTLEDFIASHRRLRAANQMKMEEQREHLRKLGERVEKNMRESGEFIHINDLRKMTLQEIVDRIGSNDD